MNHPAAQSVELLLRDCEVRRVRRSGPGGQHRNKVESGIVLSHTPTGITAEASERRSQADNHAVAVVRLRRTLAVEVRQPVGEALSPLWQSRTRGGKIVVSESHADFPALLAEALDHLAARDWDAAGTAVALGVTTSQFVKFLKVEPRALGRLNAERQQRGVSPLK